MKKWQILALLSFSSLLTGCVGPIEWWHRVNTNARELMTLRTRHAVLEKDFKDLNQKYLSLENKYASLSNELELERARKQNQDVAGDPEGRHLANIPTVDNSDSSIGGRAKLALDHVRHGKFPEAFAIFESFLWVPEGTEFQTAETFYAAGVAAYQVRNFNRAKDYFEAANSHGNGLKDEETIRRTKLWLKVLAQREGRGVASHR